MGATSKVSGSREFFSKLHSMPFSSSVSYWHPLLANNSNIKAQRCSQISHVNAQKMIFLFHVQVNNGAKNLMSIEQRSKYYTGSQRLWSTTLLLWSIERSCQTAEHLTRLHLTLYVFLHTNVCKLEIHLVGLTSVYVSPGLWLVILAVLVYLPLTQTSAKGKARHWKWT